MSQWNVTVSLSTTIVTQQSAVCRRGLTACLSHHIVITADIGSLLSVHTTRVHEPCSRPVNTTREHG